ncbi:adenylosuccinate lyase [Candidatus Aerophobetes bacterium]|uniref:Adenylosuccinate lyase n=1 Tax=Aerophobetes bacterium TaxID=2030807 RepID=A0A523W212_UNCAE|nr:MAG: adenylosuccinate lyase [Candidatus Aerophobetes bacterium]
MIPRYTLPRMGKIWKEEEKFALWLKIEVLACEAWAELGEIPKGAVAKIKERAKFDIVRTKEIEKEVKHDVLAFLTNLAESIGPEARYVHLGLTSSDILDTTLALQMKRAGEIIIEDLTKLAALLKKKARQYKDIPMVGRTHGVHAEPTTLGLKFALWFEETNRNLERMRQATKEIACGKISGAVGTYAHLNPRVEEYVCEKLDLVPAPVSTQIISRDRHAYYLSILALIGSSLDRFALEIRLLQRTETRELEEPFTRGQKGSSAMPHKRNPILCERICGLARLVRSNAQAALENVSLWGERDISHSSVERVIIPDTTILVDYMLEKFIQILGGLSVYEENMKVNLQRSRGLVFSEGVLLKLVKKGLSREKAYQMVQRCAMKSWEENRDFEELVRKDSEIAKYLDEKEIKSTFNLAHHLRWGDRILERLEILPGGSGE